MTVTSAAFNEYGLIVAVIDGVTMTVPNDQNNSERRAIAEWEAAGNTITSATTPEPTIPSSVTIRQAKLQMSRAGILAAVDSFIEGMEGQDGEEARIEWAYATELRRDHPLVAALGPQFDLTDADIDDLFLAAADIA